MAKNRSAEKRSRKSNDLNSANASVKTGCRTLVRSFLTLLQEKPAEAEKLYPTVVASLDRAAGKGIIHPNTAARRKSRLAHLLRERLPKAEA